MGSEERTEIKYLNEEECKELFDEAARKYANMSGQEFIDAWDAGLFKGKEESVMRVAMLIPFWTR